MLMMVIFLTLIALLIISQVSLPAREDIALSKRLLVSKQSSFLSESGLEDVSFRIRKAWMYNLIELLKLNNFTATTSVSSNINTGEKRVTASSLVKDSLRSKSILLTKGDKASFNYAIQTGPGGLSMANSSFIVGNIYSDGPVTGSNNLVKGSVVSAGPNGIVNGIYATSSVWAHTIQNSTVDGDAYYQSIANTTVGGTSYPGSPDKATSSFPISESKLEEWKQIAQNGGVINSPCPYRITANVTLGPKKINCDLEISNNPIVSISGPIWVVGDITFKNNSVVKIDSSLGRNSVQLLADNPLNRDTSSRVLIQNSIIFQNSGTTGSYIFLISRNNGGVNNSTVNAIELNNTAQGDVILYTNGGRVSIGNYSKLRSVTGWQISLKNSAQLLYDEGLENSLFDTGPGGSWSVESWKEVE